MAKKKTAPAAKPAPVAKKATPAKKTSAPAKGTPVLSCEDIGHTAGKVWKALSDGGEHTTTALKKAVDAPGDLVIAAVGWLAREEKLDFISTGRTIKIALR